MCHLVRDHAGDLFFRRNGSGLRVDQQVRLAVGDAAKVLHGAGLKVRQRDHVQLGHGVLDAKIVVVIMENILRRFHGELRILHLVRGRTGTDRHPIGAAFGALEVSHQEGDEVGRHLRRRCELQGVLARSSRRIGNLVGVRYDRIRRIDRESDVVGRLQCGLIKAGERAPGVGRFELGHGIVYAPWSSKDRTREACRSGCPCTGSPGSRVPPAVPARR